MGRYQTLFQFKLLCPAFVSCYESKDIMNVAVIQYRLDLGIRFHLNYLCQESLALLVLTSHLATLVADLGSFIFLASKFQHRILQMQQQERQPLHLADIRKKDEINNRNMIMSAMTCVIMQ